jgi:hypothetical protein
MKGNSCVQKTSAGKGQTIVTSHGRDNSSYDVPKGGKMGGSTTNLSHSLSGSSSVQTGNEKGK